MRPTKIGTISLRTMAAHIDSGAAEPLMAGVPNPVKLKDDQHDGWWAVFEHSRAGGYRPVTDPQAIAVLDDFRAQHRKAEQADRLAVQRRPPRRP